MKTIWLVNKYAMPPQYESRLRTIKFAHYLTEAGYNVIVFGASVMHNMNIDLLKGKSIYMQEKYGNINFVHIKTISYKKTNGIARVISDTQFHYRLKGIAKQFPKPDIIIATTSPLLTNPLLNYAHKNNIKYYSESLDVWPDDFVDFGLLSKKNPIVPLLFAQAKKNYMNSDELIFSWEGCIDYLKDKKWDKQNGGSIDLSKVHYINNGVDLNDFNSFKENYIIEDEDLSNSSMKKIIYLGSIRLANNVMQLIKAAELLQDRKDVIFLIYGDGDDRNKLEEYCRKKDISNIKFKDKWIDPKYVPYVLTRSYLNILNYISSDFAKNGISSSKMFQYMASGRPIVCNIDIKFCPISKNNIGIAREFKTSLEYSNAIRNLLDIDELSYKNMCDRSKIAAKEFDYKYLTAKLIKLIEK